MVPGWGLLLGDDLSEMSRQPGHPNSVGPRRRAVTNMAPTMVFRDGRPVLAMGSPGFHRIISAQVQTLINMVHRGENLAEAVARPRVHAQDDTIFLEGDLPPAVIETIRRRVPGRVKVRRARDPYFGGIHAVRFDGDTLEGVADPRRDGVALQA